MHQAGEDNVQHINLDAPGVRTAASRFNQDDTHTLAEIGVCHATSTQAAMDARAQSRRARMSRVGVINVSGVNPTVSLVRAHKPESDDVFTLDAIGADSSTQLAQARRRGGPWLRRPARPRRLQQLQPRHLH
jgi:hypothetical protein